ncbi:probable acyl-activating enzyme 1, peroxisomal [Eucalyptus grandis]|uniref:probable acyl-activating enzyme 1, peroxisomal n=1 Tax=Eucalyptus grandis TaxID=71139 RepID=UPI000526F827|nr:probable acyl-activating enzyme 1, peroxisomal [Eucalyptus grandis]
MDGLLQCPANYVPLSPISFLERAAFVFGNKVSIIYGDTRYTWRETHERCLKLASALTRLKISRGDIVAAMAPNVPALYELHFAVPMAGATLSALNVSLDEHALTIILHRLRPKIIFVDSELIHLVSKVIHNKNDTHLLENHHDHKPLLVAIHDFSLDRQAHYDLGVREYEQTLAMGESDFQAISPADECDPISVNFTSGSTGMPKAVAYSHRAAYLNSLGLILRYNMGKLPVFLWTVDMFRCNGWCFTWAMAALGGVNVCIRNVSAKIIFDSIQLHKVTHLCGKPTILNMIADSPRVDQKPLPSVVDVIIAGAFPTNPALERVQELGLNIVYGYGMTEALGPALIRPWRSSQHHHHNDDDNDHDDHNLKCREGLHNITLEAADVKDATTMQSVPSDGETIGEVMLRGNTLMAGYLGNQEATQKAFSGGWFRTGDVGVRHVDGCIEIKDRARDAIVLGKEVISTLDIEAVLSSHPKVAEAAVVAQNDIVAGQVPCAFVKLKEGKCSNAEEIVKFCAEQLQKATMVPKTVWFGDLPMNSTGKVQKSVLRERANAIEKHRP